MELTVAGKTVRAATGGRPLDQGRPLLVLLHGAGMDHTVWALVMRALAHGGYSVLAPDLPGHGKSEGPIPKSVEDYAMWTASLIEATGFTSAHLAGHSLGSAIALQTAAADSDLASSLILMGMAATTPVHPDLQAAADAGEHRAIELIMSWGLGPNAQMGRHPVPGMAMRATGTRLMESVDAAALAADLRSSGSYTQGLEAAAAVACPALLILGRRDQMTPARNAEPLIEALRDVSSVTIPDAGHMMMVEDPNRVIDETLAFLATVEA
ncbi:MAG TPA: alpha/beta hydrolase [Acidimicrobiia bacterium]|jgi:pimeloyl-ACP methyl ester carboxylesterase|nr:alpha/beta hydrolase [Acidimicrobiia bacterium]